MIEMHITSPELGRLTVSMLMRSQKLAHALSESVEKAGYMVESAAKQALTEGPTRAIKTGLLRATTRMYEFDSQHLKASIYPIVDYALFVHEGTKYMQARPFMKEAVRLAGPAVTEMFENDIKEALR